MPSLRNSASNNTTITHPSTPTHHVDRGRTMSSPVATPETHSVEKGSNVATTNIRDDDGETIVPPKTPKKRGPKGPRTPPKEGDSGATSSARSKSKPRSAATAAAATSKKKTNSSENGPEMSREAKAEIKALKKKVDELNRQLETEKNERQNEQLIYMCGRNFVSSTIERYQAAESIREQQDFAFKQVSYTNLELKQHIMACEEENIDLRKQIDALQKLLNSKNEQLVRTIDLHQRAERHLVLCTHNVLERIDSANEKIMSLKRRRSTERKKSSSLPRRETEKKTTTTTTNDSETIRDASFSSFDEESEDELERERSTKRRRTQDERTADIIHVESNKIDETINDVQMLENMIRDAETPFCCDCFGCLDMTEGPNSFSQSCRECESCWRIIDGVRYHVVSFEDEKTNSMVEIKSQSPREHICNHYIWKKSNDDENI